MNTKNLKSSTIVITGASSGIGRAAALSFAKEGAFLVLASRSETLLQQLAEECESLGGRAMAVYTDVSKKDSVEHLFETALSFFGSIDIWINNAGVGAVGEFTKTPLRSHEQIIRTNLFGAIYGAYAVLPHFLSRGKGTLINTNSTGAFIGAPYSVGYSASKFGLRGFSEALRSEYRGTPDIHICDIFASFVDSPGMSHAANYMGKEIKPAPPLVDPEVVAQAMVKLAKNPKTSIHLGSADRLGRFGHMILPGLTEKIMETFERLAFKKAKNVPKTHGNLFAPSYNNASVHGGYS